MESIKIVIDSGHGGFDWGLKSGNKYNKGYDGCLEKNINLEIANRFAWFCSKNHSIPYIMTQWGDRYISLRERCTRANSTNANLFISIHCNWASNPEIKGVETWCFTNSNSGKRWGQKCQNLLQDLNYTSDRGLKETNKFSVLRYTKMPAILIELGFLSNKEDCTKLNNPNFQERIAGKLFEIVRHLSQ